MIFKDTFEEITVGDVILIKDHISDLNPRMLRVDDVSYDEEYISNENMLGLFCSCTDLKKDLFEIATKESYLMHLNERCQLSDEDIRALWKGLTDVPMNPFTECLEQPYFIFPAGISRIKIWKWFDEIYIKGVSSLLYGDDETKE